MMMVKTGAASSFQRGRHASFDRRDFGSGDAGFRGVGHRAGSDTAGHHPCDAPATTPAAPPKPPELRPVPLSRFVPSAEERTIAFYSSLFPDCSSKGAIVGRILDKPGHGALSFVPTDSFPSYGTASTLAVCNNKKVPGINITYKSDDSYVGEDQASVLLIFPDGFASQLQILFLVR
jgi:hypothetical protein